MSADRLRTVAAACLLFVSAALVTLTLAASSEGRKERGAAVSTPAKAVVPSAKPKPGGLLLLGRNARFPTRALPTVPLARDAESLGGDPAESYRDACGENVDVGDWCILSSTFPVPAEDQGKNNFFYATRACAALGGWLPSAGDLLGVVDRVKLSSTIDDNPLTASVDTDAGDGLRDRREMSSTLMPVRGGSASAGSVGVTEGSRGNPAVSEPDPAPAPADPSPETMQYVTVYDNKDKGGFGGAKPVGQPEAFRCAFPKTNRVKGAE